MMDPFAEFRTEKKAGAEDFKKLADLLDALVASERAVEDAEQKLKAAQEQHRQLSEFDIPEFMEELGLKQFTTEKGLRVGIDERIRASIGNRKVAAFKWLIDHGHDSLIKRTVSVAFNKGQEEAATELLRKLREEKVGAGVKQELKVEPATLVAFVREALAAGIAIPRDVFGVFEQRFAKIEMPQ